MDTQTQTKPDLARIRKRIKDRERRFKAMSPERKRMAIARDVIAGLGTLFEAATGNWVSFGGDNYLATKAGQDLRDVWLESPPENCTACALGALFTCAVMRDDRVKIEDGYEWQIGGISLTPVVAKIRGYFTEYQLRLIEITYERGKGWYTEARRLDVVGAPSVDFETEFNKAVLFGCRYDLHRERMVAIMKNIITNKGEFKP